MTYRTIFLIFLSLFMGGCTSIGTPLVEPDSKINPSVAYIYGKFYVLNEKDTLSTLNMVSSPSIVYSISDNSDQKIDGHIVFSQEEAIKAIPIKPGTYTFGKVLFAAHGQERKNKWLLKNNNKVIETLVANKAYYVGDYSGYTMAERTGGGTIFHWKLTSKNSSFTTTTKIFSDKYKKFKNIEKIDLTGKLGIAKSNTPPRADLQAKEFEAPIGSNKTSTSDNLPINMMPMYGYPNIEKTTAQKNADKNFIENVTNNSGSREKASMKFAGEAWRNYKAGDYSTAMRRFNQSWLLNSENYLAHWGFGALLFDQGKTNEAIIHYDKALSAIDNNAEKPRLLTDAARAYSKNAFTEADKLKTKEFFRKTNSLYKEALTLDPHYDNVYRDWPRSLYLEGNYKKAWEVIKQSRTLGSREISPDFIDALSKKMPEPN